MKTVIAGALAVLSFLSVTSFAQSDYHAKHNMVLFGESELFASHIVYKAPHNYQVVLKVHFDDRVKSIYLRERELHPQDRFIFLLDEMNIKDIESSSSISGALLRANSAGNKIVLAEGVIVNRSAFSILFFNEIPLSLE